MNFKSLKNKQGTTLLEVLIASEVLIIGLAAILTSALAFLDVTAFSKNYLTASQMAKEAVEVVRNKRDENWLNGRNFDYLDGPDKLTNIDWAIIKFPYNYFDGQLIIEPIDLAMDACITTDQIDQSCQLHFFSNANYNLYGNGSLTGFTDEPINFYRLLTFEPITCEDAVFEDWRNGDIDDLCVTGDIIGVEVKATVKWYKNSQLQSVEVADKLFDWQ